MSAEGLKTFFDVGAIILLFLTFAFGVGAYFTGNIINQKQAEQLRNFDKDLTNAKTELGKQQVRAANAETNAAEAKQAADREKLAREQLQAQMAPRRLRGAQVETLGNSLKQNPGVIVIVSAVLDGESADLADDFESAFKLGGWKTLRYKNRITEERGIQIGTVVGTTDGGEAKEISTLIGKIGFDTKPTSFKEDDHSTSPWFQQSVMYLVVNHKPEFSNSDGFEK